MRILVFDIWGDYAHFRKFYTTSSSLTFSFPPPSTLGGILGAVYGAGKDKYLNIFASDKCKIALKLVNQVKKVRMGINHINTKGNYWIPYRKKNHDPRTQIRTEFLKDPFFRIYFSHQDDTVQEKVTRFVKEHQTVYTVSLGLSELLADFSYIGVYNSEEITDGETVDISTPITESNLIPDGLEIEEGKKYFKEKMPIVMNSERVIEKYDDVIFEPEGQNKTIKAKLRSYQKLENGENVAFFQA